MYSKGNRLAYIPSSVCLCLVLALNSLSDVVRVVELQSCTTEAIEVRCICGALEEIGVAASEEGSRLTTFQGGRTGGSIDVLRFNSFSCT